MMSPMVRWLVSALLLEIAGCASGRAGGEDAGSSITADATDHADASDGALPDAEQPGPCMSSGCFQRPIALGEKFGCAIRSNQKVACWGDGQWGALGDGAETDNAVPAEIELLSNVVQVTAGYKHACALLDDSTVWCWGYNTFNQLGDGNTTGPEACDDGGGTSMVRCSKSPVRVAGLPASVVQVEAGKFYTCALTRAGAMYCWGSPQDGVLGNGMTTGQFASATLSTIANAGGSIAMLAPGNRHNCVLLAAGTDRIRCWGYQGNGRLGNGASTAAVVTTPQTVVLANVGFVSSGDDQSCAVLTNGAVHCWGDNAQYELGNNSTSDSSTPVAVSNAAATDRVSVEIGDSLGHVCTATTSGATQCWGSNGSGECGPSGNPVTTATTVAGVSNVTHIATGIYASCAYLTDGSVRCWGMKSQCQMGNNDCGAGTQPTPVQVSNFP
jgi:alpha-tubulin suppressor-like RCC1 family protein